VTKEQETELVDHILDAVVSHSSYNLTDHELIERIRALLKKNFPEDFSAEKVSD
jgi:hypothetical protein